MGDDRGNRLKHSALPANRNSLAPDTGSILRRLKVGCQITPEQLEKIKEALIVLKEFGEAAETDRRYTYERYQGKATRVKMRDAELLRSECMLHATDVVKLLIHKALEQDDPTTLQKALRQAEVLKFHILDRGFFKLDAPVKPATPSLIKRIELDADSVEGFAQGLRQKIGTTYNIFVYAPLEEICNKMGILLCPYEQLVDGTPLPPSLTVSNA